MGDNILGAMPIKRLVVTMSLPIMCSMLISALYNMVDSVCVAQVGDQEFLALSYAYPVLYVCVCVRVCVCICMKPYPAFKFFKTNFVCV